jgi:hypothetical protein
MSFNPKRGCRDGIETVLDPKGISQPTICVVGNLSFDVDALILWFYLGKMIQAKVHHLG